MPGSVQRLHHLLELADLLAVGGLRRVGRVRREERRRLIAPQVEQRLAGKGIHAIGVGLFKLVDRKQLDRGHAQLLQIGNLLDEPGECAGMRHARRGMPGEAAHVHLVDDAVDQRNVERLIVLPVEMVLHHQAVAVGTRSRLELAPGAAVGERARIRIEQHVRRDRSDRSADRDWAACRSDSRIARPISTLRTKTCHTWPVRLAKGSSGNST